MNRSKLNILILARSSLLELHGSNAVKGLALSVYAGLLLWENSRALGWACSIFCII